MGLCLPHTCANGGLQPFKNESGVMPFLQTLWSDFQKIVKNSNVANQLWKAQTDQSLISHSAIKWWSKFDVLEQLLVLFGDVREKREEGV